MRTFRSRHRRLAVLLGGAIPFSSFFTDTVPVTWTCQDASGDVATATNPAIAEGRTLTTVDEMSGTNWSVVAGVATHTPGSTALLGSPVLPVNRSSDYKVTYTISNRTAGSIKPIVFGNTGATQTTNNTFIETLTPDATGTKLNFEPSADFDGDISVVSLKQTGILADTSYPGAELYTTANAASDPAGNEANATTGWTASNTTLSSDGTVKSVGSYSIKSIFNSVNNAGIYFDLRPLLTTGKPYKLVFNTRHLGSGGNGSVNLSSGFFGVDNPVITLTNTDTTFQSVEYPFTHSTGTSFLNARELSGTDDGGVYLDSISITEQNPFDGLVTGAGIVSGFGGNLARNFDGLNDDIDKTSAELNSATNPLDTGFGVFIEKSTWDTNERDFVSFTVDANNWMRIGNTTTAGQIYYQYRENGTTRQVLYSTGSPTTTVYPFMIVDGTDMIAVYNGVEVGRVAITGDFVGNFDSIFIGSRGGSNFHLGKASFDGVYLTAPEVSEIKTIWDRSGN
jgi:hypothetical protein